MRKLSLFFLLFGCLFASFAQDIILRTNGDNIPCKITNADSSTVYFSIYRDGNEIATSIEKSKIKEIRYNASPNAFKQAKEKSNPESRHCTTFGLLQGGGSLVGMDIEFLLSKQIGVQAGVGFIGYGAGLNFHFTPQIRSTFISLQYWHQGIGSSHTQSLLGPSIVYRSKKGFTAQLGIAVRVEVGPELSDELKKTDAMLIYSIGWYLPW